MPKLKLNKVLYTWDRANIMKIIHYILLVCVSYLNICVCVCVCVYCQPQTVSLYHNSSVWLHREDPWSWDRNQPDFTLDFVSYRSESTTNSKYLINQWINRWSVKWCSENRRILFVFVLCRLEILIIPFLPIFHFLYFIIFVRSQENRYCLNCCQVYGFVLAISYLCSLHDIDSVMPRSGLDRTSLFGHIVKKTARERKREKERGRERIYMV